MYSRSNSARLIYSGVALLLAEHRAVADLVSPQPMVRAPHTDKLNLAKGYCLFDMLSIWSTVKLLPKSTRFDDNAHQRDKMVLPSQSQSCHRLQWSYQGLERQLLLRSEQLPANPFR